MADSFQQARSGGRDGRSHPHRAAVVQWAIDRSGISADQIDEHFATRGWLSQEKAPTLKQLEQFASRTGVPFGFLLLPEPPKFKLPVPDFRVGFGGGIEEPSADLAAVLDQSLRRQDWYREFATENELDPVEVVGIAADLSTTDAAADMRKRLDFEVHQRRGTWSDTRKHILRAFESLGGLTVATSMVGNNTHRLLDPDEFRGFTLTDRLAPLVFVNTNQTLNGQIFTLSHELAHVWRGQSGIGNEKPSADATSPVERWCNATASEFLVPATDLATRLLKVSAMSLVDQLDSLAGVYRCGTLVVLQAMHRQGLRHFDDFSKEYEAEEARLRGLAQAKEGGGGGHYNNQPFRVGERLSRAVISDALEGGTTFTEALSLMSMRSVATFDEYARRLGAA